jgi:hypothetical protein
VIEVPDGNLILAGGWNSKYWLLNLRPSGELVWEKKYGDAGISLASRVRQHSARAILLAGSAIAEERAIPFGDLDGVRHSRVPDSGDFDYWLVGTDDSGKKLWDLAVGGLRVDELTACVALEDGSLVIGGSSNANADGVKTTPPTSGYDYWVVKLSAPIPVGPPSVGLVAQTGTQLRQHGFRVALTGGGSNCTYAIEQSFGMGPPWRAFSTNRFVGERVEIIDPRASNQIQRFYRARHLP